MQARILPAIRGAVWIVNGLHLYQRNPPLLSLLTMSYMMLGVLFALLQPLGPLLLPLILPMVTTLVANACRVLEHGRLVPPQSLVAGLAAQRRNLLRLGVLQLFGTLLILALDQILPGGNIPGLENTKDPAALEKIDPEDLLLAMLRILMLGLPVALSFWFAPLLTAWHGVPAAKALFFSMIAVWRNWRAFLVYAVTALLVGVLVPGLLLLVIKLISGDLAKILGAAMELILLLVFAPVMMTVTYQGYRDIFQTPGETDNPDPAADTHG